MADNQKFICEQIVTWLKNYAIQYNKLGFVVGISGGIDSAVTSTLCAMTGLNVLAIRLPIGKKSIPYSLSELQCDWLKNNFGNVSQSEVDLTESFNTAMMGFGDSFHSNINRNADLRLLAVANVHARLRMTALYYAATINNLLVCGTGNKVEDYGVGFFTKYGDGGIDLSPIGELNKTEVYELAAYLGIPQDIRNARPTDGLWEDGRTDEDQIGATYPELEWAMEYADNNPSYTMDDMRVLTKRQLEVLNIYNKRHKANLHKMQMPPVCKVDKL